MSATTLTDQATAKPQIEELETVTIRFAGDSGDGMQVTGSQFTSTSAIIGNDISTLPDFPAEIRAPAGSLPGVSGYQLNFSSRDIRTPGDEPQVLVAMNPAALKTNLPDLESGGILVVNTDEFNSGNLKKAGYASNPIEDGSLSGYRLFKVPITSQTLKSLEGSTLPFKLQERCKNFYALGLMYWLYDRPMEPTLKWVDEKFGNKPEVAEANVLALKAGFNYADTMEIFNHHYT
ncbi:MAG: 2-oxoacid:acceptor oxidoreductase family protein, partial [Acidobacteria bacterium]|nr:2-oxoacid:acceptor oxidoreductase family protein [Acidobacteriota bacterium]